MKVIIQTENGPWEWTWNEDKDRFENLWEFRGGQTGSGTFITPEIMEHNKEGTDRLLSMHLHELQRMQIGLDGFCEEALDLEQEDLDSQPLYDALEGLEKEDE